MQEDQNKEMPQNTPGAAPPPAGANPPAGPQTQPPGGTLRPGAPQGFGMPGAAPPPAAPRGGYSAALPYIPYGFAPPLPAPPPKRRGAPRRALPLSTGILAVSLALAVLAGVLLASFIHLGVAVSSFTQPQHYNADTPDGSFSVVQVVGDIQSVGGGPLGVGDPSYHHGDTVAYIKSLTQHDGNAGILLYMNTPGGTVYEADEVYLALLDYKEKTGRPVWVYMGDTCASAGYYIAAAADRIVANRNTVTGSIGVYIAMSDTSAMYEELGVKTVLVRSGEHKGAGMEGVPITEEQRSVYQGVVDELYQRFVQIVADGRGMTYGEAQALSDGRVYTARQALENGLVDEVDGWDETLDAFAKETAASAFYPNFSRATALGSLIGTIVRRLPQNEAQTLLELAEKWPSGVPLSYCGTAVTQEGPA